MKKILLIIVIIMAYCIPCNAKKIETKYVVKGDCYYPDGNFKLGKVKRISNKKVIVLKNGVLNPKKCGKTIVYGSKKTIKFIVMAPEKKYIRVKAGNSVKLKIKNSGKLKFKWTVDDKPSYVKITQKGVISSDKKKMDKEGIIDENIEVTAYNTKYKCAVEFNVRITNKSDNTEKEKDRNEEEEETETEEDDIPQKTKHYYINGNEVDEYIYMDVDRIMNYQPFKYEVNNQHIAEIEEATRGTFPEVLNSNMSTLEKLYRYLYVSSHMKIFPYDEGYDCIWGNRITAHLCSDLGIPDTDILIGYGLGIGGDPFGGLDQYSRYSNMPIRGGHNFICAKIYGTWYRIDNQGWGAALYYTKEVVMKYPVNDHGVYILPNILSDIMVEKLSDKDITELGINNFNYKEYIETDAHILYAPTDKYLYKGCVYISSEFHRKMSLYTGEEYCYRIISYKDANGNIQTEDITDFKVLEK